MSTNDHDEFARRAKAAFDADVDGLDAATRSKLNQARQRALGELERPRRMAWGAPQTAFAAVAVAAIGGWLLFSTPQLSDELSLNDPPAGLQAAATDIDILLAEDDLEFITDVEFYAWLEAQPEFEALLSQPDGAG